MKGERVGEFEELILLALQAVDDNLYAVAVQRYLEQTTGRSVSLGAVYAGLDRLEAKGLLRSSLGEATAERGGKRKRLFSVTREGIRTVQEIRRVREAIWRAIEARR